jgi:hypothetical protein
LLVAIVGCGCAFSPGQAITGFADGGPHRDASTTVGGDAKACAAYPLKNGASSYRLTVGNQVSWMDAQIDCTSDGGHLAMIEDATENDVITQGLTGNAFVWFGLSKRSGQLVWIDGTPIGAFTNFPNGSGPNGSCIDLNTSSGSWYPFFCNYKQQGLCECQ